MAASGRIFELLVNGSDDAVGAIAYVLYKQHKGAYIQRMVELHGRRPTPDEFELFHELSALAPQLESFRARAEELSERLIRHAVAARTQGLETDTRESVLISEIIGIQAALGAVLAKLSERRTVRGWLADVASNLTVNFASIALLGTLVLGYALVNQLNTRTQTAVNLSAALHPDSLFNALSDHESRLGATLRPPSESATFLDVYRVETSRP